MCKVEPVKSGEASNMLRQSGLSSTSSSLFFNAMWSGQILVKSKGNKKKDHEKLPLWKGLFSSSGDSGVSEESDAVLSSEPTIL